MWLKHVDHREECDAWAEPLKLANGSTTPCRTRTGPKGIPQALIQKNKGEGNIDLIPMYWLIDRWVNVQWIDRVTLTTPKGNVHTLSCWNDLPYLTEGQLEQVLADLPAANAPGRSGKRAGTKVASLCIILGPTACAARLPVESVAAERAESSTGSRRALAKGGNGTNKGGRQAIRKSLQHLSDEVEKDNVEKLVRKYQSMPDVYYDGGSPIGPDELVDEQVLEGLGLEKGKPVKL